MTTPRRRTRTPFAVLGGIVILVFAHVSTQDSATTLSRTLPFLLILILGELVREWTVGRLSPSTDEETARLRRRLGWMAGIAGVAFLTIPLIGLYAEWLPKRSLWIYVLLAASMVCAGVATAVMLVVSQAKLDAKRLAMARSGQQPEYGPPGPLVFLFVLVGALTLFALVNATVIETLLARQALSATQWARMIVSAPLCGGLAFVVLRKMSEFADRAFDPESPDPS